MPSVSRLPAALVCCLLGAPLAAMGDSIDHRVTKDTGGVWRYQAALPYALSGATVAGALWLGADDRLGKTLWQSTDGIVISAALTEGLKLATERVRPADTDNAGQWFRGVKHDSFPSGHVAVMTASVTPLIMEYRDEHPWVLTLAALPVYEAVGRVKAQAHWQTDVIAGLGLGFVSGYYAHTLNQPLMLQLLPDGVAIGIRKSLP